MISSSTMNKKWILIVLVISFAAVVLSGLSLREHYLNIETGFHQDSFCSINNYVDCSKVDASEYSSFRGVPSAGLGFVLFLIILLYSVFSLSSTQKYKPGLLFCFFLAKITFLVTLFMAYQSFFVIQALCLICIGMYLCHLALLICLPKAAGFSYSELLSKFGAYIKAIFGSSKELGFKPRFFLHSFISLAILLSFSALFLKVSEEKKNAYAIAQLEKKKKDQKSKLPPPQEIDLNTIINLHYEQPSLDISVDASRPVWGNPKAAVKLIEFSDFQCPYCSRAAQFLKQELQPWKEEIAFYFVNYPLDKNCNPAIQRDFHQYACMAASASLCAHKEGKFWQLHDEIFANQRQLNEKLLENLIQKVGLNLSETKACMESSETKQMITEDLQLGRKAGVRGTPTVIINGRKVNGWNNPEFLQALIETEIDRSN